MESSSTLIYTSPSFNTNPFNNITNIADRVVNELITENKLNNDNNNNNIFSFNDNNEDEHEFEFPVVSGDSNLFQNSSHDQISPRYPLFDRSLLSDVDVNIINGVNTSVTESKPPLSTRLSLMKLFDDDHETTSSSSDDLDGVMPETYCVWTPKTEPNKKKSKHKKSHSISIDNTSNKWKVRDLLKRSYSDDHYSVGKESPVIFFIPPNSPEKVKQIGKGGRLKNIPANKSKIGNVRLPPYLPYREDQLAAYANFNGMNNNNNNNNNNIYRY